MNFIRNIITVLLVCCSSNAFAADEQAFNQEYYLKAAVSGIQTLKSSSTTTWKGGVVEQPFSANKTYGLTVGVGGYINRFLRGELSARYINKYSPKGIYSYKGAAIAETAVDLTTVAVMQDIFVELAPLINNLGFKNDWKLKPYIGIGAGYAKHKINAWYPVIPVGITFAGATTGTFAWEAVAGYRMISRNTLR